MKPTMFETSGIHSKMVNQSRFHLPRCRLCRIEVNDKCECFNGFLVTREQAALPCPFLPGTPEKAAVLSARLAHNLPLWLTDDGEDKSHKGEALLLPTRRELLLIEAAGCFEHQENCCEV